MWDGSWVFPQRVTVCMRLILCFRTLPNGLNGAQSASEPPKPPLYQGCFSTKTRVDDFQVLNSSR